MNKSLFFPINVLKLDNCRIRLGSEPLGCWMVVKGAWKRGEVKRSELNISRERWGLTVVGHQLQNLFHLFHIMNCNLAQWYFSSD